LWVGAICINQVDLEERQVQVSRMGDIYRLASDVVAYIGEETENSAQAMTYLASMDGSRWNDPIPTTLQRALEDLLSRPWFSRVWVLQEVFNARSVHMVCGQHKVNWSNLQLFRWWHRLGRQDIHSWPLVTTIMDRSSYHSRDLLNLLTQARQCGATDERDRLYALLPMLRDATNEGLVPDYKLSREQVFLKFATYISR
ncbi:heterokaryon incompatibility protein-domain-containing protein, partial [Phaeosphaeriaceae sp. PMI808]